MPPKEITKETTKEQAIQIMQEKMERLMKENDELKKRQYVPPEISFKINDRGAIEIIGLSKFRHMFYADQALRLLDKADDLRRFINDNENDLSWISNKNY